MKILYILVYWSTLESLLAELEVQWEPVEDEVAEEVVEIEDLKIRNSKFMEIEDRRFGCFENVEIEGPWHWKFNIYGNRKSILMWIIWAPVDNTVSEQRIIII